MDYSQLSDFEINKRVGIALGKELMPDDCQDFGLSGFPEVMLRNGDFKDYCNNPADAWPIIDESNIALIPSGGFGWVAVSNLTLNGESSYIDERLDDCFQCEDWSGLRAAMIVFLMMQDAKHA